MSAIKITTTEANAPFQTEWEIDATRLDFAGRTILLNALTLEIFGMTQEPWHAFAEDRSTLIIMDATSEVIESLTAVVDRYEQRHTIKAEEVELPKIPLRARFAAWLNPRHAAPATLKRLGNVCKVDGRYQFEIEMHSTDADLHFIKIMKGAIAAPSCRGASMKVRGTLLTIKAKRAEPVRKVWSCAQAVSFDKPGLSPAICPLWLWFASMVPAFSDD